MRIIRVALLWFAASALVEGAGDLAEDANDHVEDTSDFVKGASDVVEGVSDSMQGASDSVEGASDSAESERADAAQDAAREREQDDANDGGDGGDDDSAGGSTVDLGGELLIKLDGDPALREIADNVNESDLACTDPNSANGCASQADAWVATMLRGMKQVYGNAISASQVGISKRIVLISVPAERIKDEPHHAEATVIHPPIVMLNPLLSPIDPKDGTEDWATAVWEMCLSHANVLKLIPRFKAVFYTATRLDGQKFWGHAYGRLAYSMQQQLDYLNATLISDYESLPVSGYERLDSFGTLNSTTHWKRMARYGYNIRTAMFKASKITYDEMDYFVKMLKQI